MPISKKEFDEALDLKNLAEKWIAELEKIAHRLGFKCEQEVQTNGGRVDLVWFHELDFELPNIGNKLPIVGFEIETSWRTRKHIKGDIFNILELSPACGVILFLSEGFKKKSKLTGNIRAAKKYVQGYRGISRILVLTEKDIIKIVSQK